MAKKWYSNGFTEESVRRFDEKLMEIKSAEFGLNINGNGPILKLEFKVIEGHGPWEGRFDLCTNRDRKALLIGIGVTNISELVGKRIDVFIDYPNTIKSISPAD